MKNLFYSGLHFININKCPILIPYVGKVCYIKLLLLNLNNSIYEKNVSYIKKNTIWKNKILCFLSKKNFFYFSKDVDLQLYNGFFNNFDKYLMNKLHKIDIFSWEYVVHCFKDLRLKKLLFRMQARNFFNTLNIKKKKKWIKHCCKYFNKHVVYIYKDKIHNLYSKNFFCDKKKFILIQLLNYINRKINLLSYYKKKFFIH
ncbi:hypothetical protein RJT30_01890 [Buchnera aphidicola (Mollitrichosiphum nigrofasciatum)]|uniref:hypothetical protein n=1 Tax=Buchnera aphidicola TaxID=9 RepID=UPI0031B80A32